MLFSKLKLYIVFCLLLCSQGIANEDALSLEDLLERQKLHLMINDSYTAVSEALEGIKAFPKSIELRKALIRAYAHSVNERQTLKAWNDYKELDPTGVGDEELLEVIAWAVLRKGSFSTSIVPQYFSLVGAALSQDAYAVDFLEKGMSSSSVIIRTAAIRMTAFLRDRELVDQVMDLALKDQSWQVRVESIKLLGFLKVVQAKGILETIIASDSVNAIERSAAIQSLLQMRKGLTLEEVKNLAQRSRYGLRVLAADLIAHFELTEGLDLLGELSQDSHPKVRSSALRALAFLQNRDLGKVKWWAELGLKDFNRVVKTTAAFLMILLDQERGSEVFRELFEEEHNRWRHTIAAALSASGEVGVELAKEIHDKSQDRFVKVNLALGLIKQQVNVKDCGESIRAFLTEYSGKIAFDQGIGGDFQVLSYSQVRNLSYIKNYPNLVDQMTRFKLMNVLAVIEHPSAQETLRNYFIEADWHLTGEIALLMLREGDESLYDLVRGLLEDENANVRLSSALVLATFGRDSQAIPFLYQAYEKADRENKIQIINALGQLKSRDSLKFLEECLGDSSQTLRIVAASSMLRCLRA